MKIMYSQARPVILATNGFLLEKNILKVVAGEDRCIHLKMQDKLSKSASWLWFGLSSCWNRSASEILKSHLSSLPSDPALPPSSSLISNTNSLLLQSLSLVCCAGGDNCGSSGCCGCSGD